MNAVLSADNLGLSYPGRGLLKTRSSRTVLQDVSLSIATGRSIGLVGGSGAGKSTLLRILLALEKPNAGNVTFNNTPVVPGSASSLRWYRRAVQYIPQNPAASLAPGMNVERLLLEPLRQLRIDGDHRGMILNALQRVDLDPRMLARRSRELSGGQKQRVAIARALVPAPSILLADEPVSGLDLPLRNTVLDLMEQLVQGDGLGLLFVSHDLSAVARLCSETLVLSGGRIVERGPTAAVYGNPRTPEAKELVTSIPRLRRNQDKDQP
ncbi:ABC transporter ATP-binding protein [Arthrobacter sp. FW306-2-2C-D06B]|uniref:ABC transporter ATP-binding protein n=1 Tax=Arthrobacter sp. FW306-2-2C-D06B TaxID=2879618 RepID=UPI001F006A22|nr:ABC transporter ATP-binding protein [Arthrobacter sp. FW306-2-2C-D06B]UKA57219.1 ATP-binding cassette domain-containing protein [Arthrobacter sp. FW306-2-2C-D06B]